MENVRNRIDAHLLTESEVERFIKLTSQPNYKSTLPFKDCNLAFVEMYRIRKLDKPMYCGVSVLDLSKTLM